jgi:two-component system, NtrC family, sensor kinase
VGSVVGDADQLKQVLLNLSLNAIQSAASSEGRVSVEARLGKGGRILIGISDNGEGVKHDLQERIFDPFFTTRELGVGLGLSISYQIVQQHGGTLTLTNPGKLGGVSFLIWLPRATLYGFRRAEKCSC